MAKFFPEALPRSLLQISTILTVFMGLSESLAAVLGIGSVNKDDGINLCQTMCKYWGRLRFNPLQFQGKTLVPVVEDV